VCYRLHSAFEYQIVYGAEECMKGGTHWIRCSSWAHNIPERSLRRVRLNHLLCYVNNTQKLFHECALPHIEDSSIRTLPQIRLGVVNVV
jgi:hypothetical protein